MDSQQTEFRARQLQLDWTPHCARLNLPTTYRVSTSSGTWRSLPPPGKREHDLLTRILSLSRLGNSSPVIVTVVHAAITNRHEPAGADETTYDSYVVNLEVQSASGLITCMGCPGDNSVTTTTTRAANS